MAMSFAIRKAASPTVVPLALRAISSSPRILSSTGSLLTEKKSYFHSNQTSITADADQKLAKALSSAITNAEGPSFQFLRSQYAPDTNVVLAKPADFPFEIEDGPYELYKYDITLKRALPEESIDVRVLLPRVIEQVDGTHDPKNVSDDDDSESDSTDDDSDSDTSDSDSDSDSSDEEKEVKKVKETSNGSSNDCPPRVSIPLQVRINKKNGTCLKIEVLGCADEIVVEKMEIYTRMQTDPESYEYQIGPKFEDLAGDVQRSLKEFLKVRGITSTNAEYLIKYMIQRPYKHTGFMKELKKFVEK